MCEIETCYLYFMHAPNILRVSDYEVGDNKDITEDRKKDNILSSSMNNGAGFRTNKNFCN